MDYDEDMMCVVERRNPNNIVTLSHRFPGYHDLCNIVTISATCHITSLFSREFGNARATFLFASRRHCPTTWPQLSKFTCAGVTTSDLAIFNFLLRYDVASEVSPTWPTPVYLRFAQVAVT